ncbi:MAG: hypothetical protein IPF67_17830 [Saprospiraceae bacterium]|nr:hypothetical protein [Candidatus Brachybacter algidus]
MFTESGLKFKILGPQAFIMSFFQKRERNARLANPECDYPTYQSFETGKIIAWAFSLVMTKIKKNKIYQTFKKINKNRSLYIKKYVETEQQSFVMKQIDWKSFEYFIPQIEHVASINEIRKVVGNVMIATLPTILFLQSFES